MAGIGRLCLGYESHSAMDMGLSCLSTAAGTYSSAFLLQLTETAAESAHW